MTTIGVRGAKWRASVTAWGAVVPSDGSDVVEWWVAADDRWHTPSAERTVRQRLVDGTPVVETTLRVPGGDVVHSAYCVADHGGLTVFEIENRSSLPVAVAFSRRDVLSARPPTATRVEGISVPSESVLFPVGHRASIRIALSHHSPGLATLPGDVPSPTQVANGWVAQLERGPRLVLPDSALSERVISQRAEVLLTAPSPDDDVAWLLTVQQWFRLGEVDRWPSDDLAERAERIARPQPLVWDDIAALDAAAEVFERLGERRAAADAHRLARSVDTTPPARPPDGVRFLAWIDASLLRAVDGGYDLLPAAVPQRWFGQPIERHGDDVSFAVRWHGDRPALLWENHRGGRLRCPGLDPTWSCREARGEALLAAPIIDGVSLETPGADPT